MTASGDAPKAEAGPGRQLAIVVPMYNELAGAETCIRQILDIFPTLGMPAVLIAVDDGSDDGTGELLDQLQRAQFDFVVVHKPNGGYGSALINGARTALDHGYDYVLFMDSDLTNPPAHIQRFVPAIKHGFDLVKGTRFSAGGDMDAVAWRRRAFSLLGNIVARLLFRVGLTDCTNGFRAVRADLFVKMPLHERGFAVIMEELYWAKTWGLTATSVPTSLTARNSGQRATTFSYQPATLWSYLKYALRAALTRYRPRPMPSVAPGTHRR